MIDDPPSGLRQPQRRPAPVPRQPPLLRHRRRRLRRRPAQQRPEQGRPARASCSASTPGPRRQALLDPARQPVRRPDPGRGEIYSYGLRNPFRFSFDTVSAGAAADRDRRRRPEPLRGARLHHRGPGDGANFGWDAFEGYSAYHDENSGTPDPGGTVKPIFAYPHSRDGSCSIIGGYVVRDRSLARSTATTSTPTSARASCEACAPPAPGERRPPPRPDGRLADLVRRRHQRQGLRRLARRSGLPAGRPVGFLATWPVSTKGATGGERHCRDD